MFSGCSSLKKLDVSKLDTSAVKNMEYMFSGCSALEELDISNFEIRDDAYAYSFISGCNGLQKFTTPQNVDDSACVYIDKMYDENGNEYERLPENSKVLFFSRISLDKNEIELKEGESTKLNALTNNDKIKNLKVEWYSDYSIVTVDDMGNISANYVGNAYVTAKFGNSVSSCFVKVIENESTDEPKNDYPSDDTPSENTPSNDTPSDDNTEKPDNDDPVEYIPGEKKPSDSVSNCFIACTSIDIKNI